mmetsp:Transcript_118934/g.237043  ORF Transcript_118934/g.237043 Transcript_118934/m.237043 type:complete len:201 (+) Transcript_118934:459-1061(+)
MRSFRASRGAGTQETRSRTTDNAWHTPTTPVDVFRDRITGKRAGLAVACPAVFDDKAARTCCGERRCTVLLGQRSARQGSQTVHLGRPHKRCNGETGEGMRGCGGWHIACQIAAVALWLQTARRPHSSQLWARQCQRSVDSCAAPECGSSIRMLVMRAVQVEKAIAAWIILQPLLLWTYSTSGGMLLCAFSLYSRVAFCA